MPCAPSNLLRRLQRQQDPDDLSVRYKEYSDADVWGDETDIALIFELSLNTLEKTLAAVKGACDTGGQSCTGALCVTLVVGGVRGGERGVQDWGFPQAQPWQLAGSWIMGCQAQL